MAQILIVMDKGDIDATVGLDHKAVRISDVGEVRRALSTQTFQAAIVESERSAEADAAITALRAADPDLAIVLISDARDTAEHRRSPNLQVWEVLHRPVSAEDMRSALRRAIQYSQVSRENRALRRHAEPRDAASAAIPQNGHGANLQWIESLPPRFDLRELLSTVEKNLIQRTLQATRGAQAEAARRLGLSRSDLSYKLAKYELRKRAERQD